MPEAFEQDYPLQQLKQVTKSLNSGQFVQVRRMLAKTAPCDTALLLESSPHKIRRLLWQLVDPDVQGDVLEELSEDVRLGIIAQMAPEHIAAATEEQSVASTQIRQNSEDLQKSALDTLAQANTSQEHSQHISELASKLQKDLAIFTLKK